MVEKLFIPKNILKNIADSIRNKTGKSDTIQVKNMSVEIDNIPSSMPSISTYFSGEYVECSPSTMKVFVTLMGIYENDIKLVGGLENAQINIYGTEKNNYDHEYLDSPKTGSEGLLSYELPYEEIFMKVYKDICIHFTQQKGFKESKKTIKLPYAIFIVNTTDKGMIQIRPFQNNNLITHIDGKLFPNVEGLIKKENLPLNTDVEVSYQGEIRNMGGNLFDDVKEIIIPSGCYPDVSFDRHETLESIIIQNPQVFSYFEAGFSYCSKLKYVRLPHSIKKLANNMFEGCSLDYLNIPSSINGSLDLTLANCNIRTLEIENGEEIGEFDANTFALDDSKTQLENIIMVGKNSDDTHFRVDHNWLNSLRLNESLHMRFQPNTKRILENSSGNCKYLDRISFPIGCNYIEDSAFKEFETSYDAENTSILHFESSPPIFGMNNNPDYVFHSSVTFTVVFPARFREHYLDIFGSVHEMDCYIVDYGQTDDFTITWFGDSFKTNQVEGYIFDGVDEDCKCSVDDNNIIKETEPESYGGGNLVFSDFSNTLHDFYGFGGFTNVKEGAFSFNKNIVKFRFPANLNNVSQYAFMNCYNLRTLIFQGDCPNIEENAFSGLSVDCQVFVPEQYLENYKNNIELNKYEIIGY